MSTLQLVGGGEEKEVLFVLTVLELRLGPPKELLVKSLTLAKVVLFECLKKKVIRGSPVFRTAEPLPDTSNPGKYVRYLLPLLAEVLIPREGLFIRIFLVRSNTILVPAELVIDNSKIALFTSSLSMLTSPLPPGGVAVQALEKLVVFLLK